MNLNGLKLSKEDADAFHVTGKDGKTFRVSKKGLSATMHGRIAQHFAEGGEVQDPSGGEGSPFPAASDYVSAPAAGTAVPDAIRQNNSGDGQWVPNMTGGLPLGQAGNDEQQSGALALKDLGDKEHASDVAADKAKEVDEVAAATAPSAAQGAPGMPIAAPAVPGVPGLQSGTIPGLAAGIDKSTGAEKDALQKRADIETQKAAQLADVQQKGIDAQAAIQKEWGDKWQANQAKTAAVQADIASSKIDPNQFWASRSTGQKVAGIASLIIGGFYAGYTGRENPGEKMLNNAIEKDIDAQKSNLQSKNNQLKIYMDQGHSLQEAEQMAKGDALQRTAAQIQATQTKFGGAEAQASTAELAAKLDQSGLLLKQQAFAQGIGIQKERLGIALERQKAAIAAGQSGQGAAIMNAARNGTLPPQLEAQLPKEIGERVIHLTEDRQVKGPNGQPSVDAAGNPHTVGVATTRLAVSAKAAEKAQDALMENREISAKVKALKEFAASHPHGAWGPKDNQRAESMFNDLKLSFNKSQEGLNRLTPLETDLFEKIVGDPAGALGATTGRVGAGLQQLEKMVGQKKQAILGAYTVPADGQ